MKISLKEISKENDAKEIQIYFDVHSKPYMGGIINRYTYKNSLNNKELPNMPVIIHIGLDKLFENPYNEDIDDWTRRFLNMLVSTDVKYTEELAGDYEDLKEVAKIMREYSEDPENIKHYYEEVIKSKNNN